MSRIFAAMLVANLGLLLLSGCSGSAWNSTNPSMSSNATTEQNGGGGGGGSGGY